ncbi:MAG: phosphotransferase [Kofleriaceae bacterium]
MFPEHQIVELESMPPDSGATKGVATKAAGYGQPVRVTLEHAGDRRVVVWRIASANEFGHDRRSDRAANQLLAYDDFSTIPDHIRPLDVGVMHRDGSMASIGEGEVFLLTTYAPGTIYADDLRRIAQDGAATEVDLARTERLARYLATLHVPIDDPPRYRRAIRDLVGHGEGIFGMVDGYADDVPGAPRERLYELEQSCASWRRRLHGATHRLARTHGDFHPFNVVFEGDHLALLDASRGCAGDPADDVTAMAINYVLFALDTPHGWRGLGPLWQRFWDVYRPSSGLLDAAPPFFAWRALVVCNPRFYPDLGGRGRDALLGLAERALAAGTLDPRWAAELFA